MTDRPDEAARKAAEAIFEILVCDETTAHRLATAAIDAYVAALPPDPRDVMIEPRGCPTPGACSAVDTIKDLEAEVAQLREVLKPFAAMATKFGQSGDESVWESYRGAIVTVGDYRKAFAACEKENGDEGSH